jgi:hypothetical protein
MTAKIRGKNQIISAGSLAAQMIQQYPKKFSKVDQHPVAAYTPTITEFTLCDLIIDRSYQREPKPELIEKITDHFVSSAVVVPVVACRVWLEKGHEDRYSIVEGQQRVISLIMVGITVGACIEVNVESVAEEMELFDRINRYRRAVSAAVHHKHDVARKEPMAVALENAIKNTGYSIIRYGEAGDIQGVRKFHTIAKEYGDPELDEDYSIVTKSLVDFRAIWGNGVNVKKTTVPANVVAGIACLQHAHMTLASKHIDSDKLAKYLKPVYPTIRSFSKAAKLAGATELKRGSTDRGLAFLLSQAFNLNATKKDLIPTRVIDVLG